MRECARGSAVRRPCVCDARQLWNLLVAGNFPSGFASPQAPPLLVPAPPYRCPSRLPLSLPLAAEHFVAFLQRFVQHLRSRLAVNEVVSVTPTAFLEKLQEVGRAGGGL